MSWGGQQYTGYGQGSAPGQSTPGQSAYGAPIGQRPAAAENAAGYRGPQFESAGYGSAPQGGYGGAPQGSYGGTPQGGYGSTPQCGYGGTPQGGYGGTPQGGYGGTTQQGYGNASSHQGYGSQEQYRGPSASFGGSGGSVYSGAPPGVDPELWTWFQSVDTDNSGKITTTELQQALLNGNWSPFNAETCRLMIGMFDRDRSGSIDIHEFAALWKYIQDWKACFDRFDSDRSGSIDASELANAFQTFGYKLSPQFSQLVVQVFDRNKGGYSVNFDDFIQACVMLKTLTDQFRVKDVSQVGRINISYEEFLEMALDTTLNK